jgi:hypothetical protein
VRPFYRLLQIGVAKQLSLSKSNCAFGNFPSNSKSIISTAGFGDSAKKSCAWLMKLSIVSGLLISKYDV